MERASPTLARWWRSHIMAGVDYQATLDQVTAQSGFDPRYAFMIVISAGISILGLLLPSPAVLIGAMLISPLMMPILGLGFGLATFDLAEIRRSATALALGALIAIVLSAAFVAVSPIQAVTSEIAVRTKPNLFDLLVALLSALMGVYALIRGHGGAVVGVAIAIALMPPLAVIGFGIATSNGPVFFGAVLLFLTNLVTMALTAAFVARLYGFGSHLSPTQTRLQAAIIVLGLAALAIPLGLTLRQIAWETLAQRQIRDAVIAPFGKDARISETDIDFDSHPIAVRAAVLTPRLLADADARVSQHLQRALGRPVDLHIDQIDVGRAAQASENAQIAAAQAGTQGRGSGTTAAELARSLEVIAGVGRDAITLDRDRRRAIVTATPLPGATLESYRVLEQRTATAAKGWDVRLIPPPLPLPRLSFAASGLDTDGEHALATAIWAARRVPLEIAVHGSGKRADDIAAALAGAGLKPRQAGGGGAVRMEWVMPGGL